jgi:hypothetical protein
MPMKKEQYQLIAQALRAGRASPDTVLAVAAALELDWKKWPRTEFLAAALPRALPRLRPLPPADPDGIRRLGPAPTPHRKFQYYNSPEALGL